MDRLPLDEIGSRPREPARSGIPHPGAQALHHIAEQTARARPLPRLKIGPLARNIRRKPQPLATWYPNQMIYRYCFLAALALVCAATGRAATIYDNTTTDSGDFFPYNGASSSYSHIGDTVTLAGTNRLLTGAQVQLFNNSSANGTYDATLYLWQVGSPVGGSLGSFTRTGISIGAFGFPNVDFTNLNLTVPDSLVFTVAISNVSPGLKLGMGLYTGPTVGSSNPNTMITATGQTLSEDVVGNGFGNAYLRLTADPVNSSVPEPSTLSMTGGAALLLLFAARRRIR